MPTYETSTKTAVIRKDQDEWLKCHKEIKFSVRVRELIDGWMRTERKELED